MDKLLPISLMMLLISFLFSCKLLFGILYIYSAKVFADAIWMIGQ